MQTGGIHLQHIHMGGYQNYGPLLGPLNIRCRIILRTQKGTIILTTTHIYIGIYPCELFTSIYLSLSLCMYIYLYIYTHLFTYVCVSTRKRDMDVPSSRLQVYMPPCNLRVWDLLGGVLLGAVTGHMDLFFALGSRSVVLLFPSQGWLGFLTRSPLHGDFQTT